MILADENIDFRIITALRDSGLKVVSIQEEFKSVSDSEVIKISKESNSIILTEDKDFGEWVFAHKAEGLSVILLRYHNKDLDQIIKALMNNISNHSDKLFGHFTTITKNKIRRREI